MRKKNGQFEKGYHWRPTQPFREKDWLTKNYIVLQRSTGEIAAEFGVTSAAVLFWMRKHGIQRRNIEEARSIKHWGSSGSDNPMWNKRGELNPMWRGGITPDRQAFYTSDEWRVACHAVWKRDRARCQRCLIHRTESPDIPFHIHHIVSFADKELRADPSNLVLLCEPCHHFVHSRKNLHREYLSEKPDTSAPA
jgi:hypothetical protein